MRLRGSSLLLFGLGAVLVALTVAGAAALWRWDHPTVFRVALIQAAVFVLAAWMVTAPRGGAGSRAAWVVPAILGVGLLMRLLILFAPPVSTDIYRYVWDGRVQAAGINPYLHIPDAEALAGLRDEAIHSRINRAHYAPTVYPPTAQLVFLAVTRLSESVTAMKAATVAFEGLAVWALLQLLRTRDLPPERVALYAWHPLPLWEFAGSGHVDAVAIALLLAAFVAADRRSPVAAGALLAAGTLVKYFPVVTGPALWTRWDWRFPLAFAATCLVLYLPYLGAGSKLAGFLGGYVAEEGLERGSGIYLWSLLGTLVPVPPSALAIYFPLAAVSMAALALHLAFRRHGRGADVAGALGLALLFTLLLSPHYAWYFAWLVPFLCFRPSPAVVWLTGGSTMLYFVGWPPSLWGGTALYGPFLALGAAELLIRRTLKEGRHDRPVAPARLPT